MAVGPRSVSPAHSPSTPPAGYDADNLDRTIKSYVSVCEKNVRHADSLMPRVEAAIRSLVTAKRKKGADVVADAEVATMLLERLSKAGLNMVKALDEMSRLRSFLAGGPDHRSDLSVHSEVELRGMLVMAVEALGWKVIDGAGRHVPALVAGTPTEGSA